MSAPERNKCVAAVCRIVWGLTRLAASDFTCAAARVADSLHQGVDAKPGDRLAAPIQEDVLGRVTVPHQHHQLADRLDPERAPAGPIPFAPDQDRCQVALGHVRQGQVLDAGLGRLILARARRREGGGLFPLTGLTRGRCFQTIARLFSDM